MALTDIIQLILSALSAVIIPVISFLFGLGEVMLAKLLLVSIMTFFLYKASIKFLSSPTIAFIASFIVSLLGIRILPEEILPSIMTQWYAFAIIGVFLAFTMLFKTVWWQRRIVMFALIAIFASFWYFYGRDEKYIILAIILIIFLIFDSPIHKALAPLRKAKEKSDELSLKIKVKQKEIADAVAARATEEEIKPLRKELDELIEEQSRL